MTWNFTGVTQEATGMGHYVLYDPDLYNPDGPVSMYPPGVLAHIAGTSDVMQTIVRLPRLLAAAQALANAEATYREAYQSHGDGAHETGYAWDQMRKAGDAVRTVFGELEVFGA